jgi:hypothetical protein
VLRNDLSLWGGTAWDARFALILGSGRGRPSRRVIGLTNIDIPRGKQAVQAWQRLDRRTRREVIRRARRGQGHPDPRVAAIAVGRAQATLTAPLWRWVAAAGLGLLAALGGVWSFSRLVAEPHLGLGAWIGISIGCTPTPLLVIRMQARQIERANLPLVGRASP